MIEEYFDLPSADHTRLHLHSWRSVDPDKIIVVLHGMGGHGGYYRNSLAPYLTEQRAAIYAPDLRGHGRSDGQRGDIVDFGIFQEDLRAAIEFARQRHPGLPFILLAESMGTPIAINFAAQAQGQYRPDALILAACVIAPTIKPRPGEIFRTSYYMLTNRRKIAIPITGREEQGVRDLDFVQVLKTDPLFNRKISVRFLLQMTGNMNRAARLPASLTMPVLIVQGGKDITIRMRPTRAFFDQIATTEKEMHVFPDALHAVLNDPAAPQVRAVLLEWIERVIAGQKTED